MAKNVLVIGCGSYIETGYGCPGDWKCFLAAAKNEGTFADYNEEVKVVGFLRCRCPGRALVANVGYVKKNADFDAIHLSTCMVNAKPECKNHNMDELCKMLEEKYGVPVIKTTHNYG
ncbi:CGGC domain-containing protein [Thermosulfuriphilus sp.]